MHTKKIILKKTHHWQVFFILFSFLSIMFASALCGCKPTIQEKTENQKEDHKAKKMLQGIWIDEEEGSIAFRAKGDTIFYTDSLSEPVYFQIIEDTLRLRSSRPTNYKIVKLTDNILKFLNADGDEVRLVKSHDKSDLDIFEKKNNCAIKLNQGVVIKRDTIVMAGDKRLHAYVQVNPTTYKVYKQVMNDDGVVVDNAYYDNIIHIALFNGAKSLINRDFRKQDFSKYVPEEYIKESILSDIVIESVTSAGVRFIAFLTAPDSYSSYNIMIFVSNDGHYKLSLE